MIIANFVVYSKNCFYYFTFSLFFSVFFFLVSWAWRHTKCDCLWRFFLFGRVGNNLIYMDIEFCLPSLSSVFGKEKIASVLISFEMVFIFNGTICAIGNNKRAKDIVANVFFFFFYHSPPVRSTSIGIHLELLRHRRNYDFVSPLSFSLSLPLAHSTKVMLRLNMVFYEFFGSEQPAHAHYLTPNFNMGNIQSAECTANRKPSKESKIKNMELWRFFTLTFRDYYCILWSFFFATFIVRLSTLYQRWKWGWKWR